MLEVQLLHTQVSLLITNDNESIMAAIVQRMDKAEALLNVLGDEASTEARYLYHRNKCRLFEYKHDFLNALVHRLKSVDLSDSSSILKPDALLYCEIALVYINIGRPSYALLYTEKALMADNNDSTLANRPHIKMTQATCYIFLGELDRAKLIYEESLARAKSLNHKMAIGTAIIDLGDIELRKGHPEKAIKLFNQAEAHFGNSLDAFLRCLFLYMKAKCLLRLKKFDECEKIIKEGMALANETGYEPYIICFKMIEHLINIKNPESQKYLEQVAIPFLRNSNSAVRYEALEICHILEAYYKKIRSKMKALTMAAVARDILHEMTFGCAPGI